MARGDRIQILVDAGPATREFEIEATKKGRKVDVRTQTRTTDVVEVDQGGNDVRTCRFRNDRIIALLEHKVEATS